MNFYPWAPAFLTCSLLFVLLLLEGESDRPVAHGNRESKSLTGIDV